MKNKIFYGDILYADALNQVKEYKNHYLVSSEGKVLGIYKDKPKVAGEFFNYENKLIIPGFVDLHLHAPQLPLMGYKMDLELLDWLNSYVFPLESKYQELRFAKEKYAYFVEELKKSNSCYFSIFATIHTNSTIALMKLLEKSNLISYVGKVNMDRNSPNYLIEATKESMAETNRFIELSKDFKRTKPIITPRFIPSCTDDLMEFLGSYAKANALAIQSHLDENPNEIKWVSELVPNSKSYTDAYKMFNTLNNRTIMAHSVWMTDEEIKLFKESGAYIAHSPTSNANLASGIAPIRKYLEAGLNVGLGSDIAAGNTLDMFEVMNNAIMMSKMYWRYVDNKYKPLSFKEAFYLATAGGGGFFGKVGKLDKDYDLSILVLDDTKANENYQLPSLIERLERISYSHEYELEAKFVKGERVL